MKKKKRRRRRSGEEAGGDPGGEGPGAGEAGEGGCYGRSRRLGEEVEEEKTTSLLQKCVQYWEVKQRIVLEL